MNKLVKIDMTVLLVLTAMILILWVTMGHGIDLLAAYLGGLPLIGARPY